MEGSPALTGLPRVKRDGLCRRLLGVDVFVLLLFRVGLLGPVQLENRVQPDANSASLPKTTQRCHSVCEMYLPSFL